MEGSKSVTLPIVLKGGNYLLWARTAKAVLCGKGLWSHVETPPQTQQEGHKEGEEAAVALAGETKRFQEDQAVLAILQGSLDISLLEAYSYCENAKELWDTLKNVFGNISNLTRIYEVKKAINGLMQGDMEFNTYFGKFRALYAELDMLRPSTTDMAVINERKEQDRVFAMLLNLNPEFNDLIRHMLRAEKLPSLEEVCAQVQKEQGSLGLFKGKGDLPTANKGVYKQEERRHGWCDHCKMEGHTKDKCWRLHPHLRPNPRFRKPNREYTRANEAVHNNGAPPKQPEVGTASFAQDDVVRKSDLAAFLKTLKESGITYLSHKPSNSLVIDSGASHHIISNSNMLENI